MVRVLHIIFLVLLTWCVAAGAAAQAKLGEEVAIPNILAECEIEPGNPYKQCVYWYINGQKESSYYGGGTITVEDLTGASGLT